MLNGKSETKTYIEVRHTGIIITRPTPLLSKKLFNSSCQSIVKKKDAEDIRLMKRCPWKELAFECALSIKR